MFSKTLQSVFDLLETLTIMDKIINYVTLEMWIKKAGVQWHVSVIGKSGRIYKIGILIEWITYSTCIIQMVGSIWTIIL